MTRSAKPTIAAVIATGIAAGGVAAALIPSAESATFDGTFLAPAKTLTKQPARRVTRSTDAFALRFRAQPSTVRDAVRQPDPAGGPDWVVRVFDAKATRRGFPRVEPTQLCAQLGRKVDGRFGWIDGDAVFRPVPLDSNFAAPRQCRAQTRSPQSPAPALKLATLLDAPDAAEPVVRGSVLWGLTGAPQRRATLLTNGRRFPVEPGAAGGAFLRFFGPAQPVVGARLAVERGGRTTTSTVDGDSLPGQATMSYDRRDDLKPGSMRIIARAPDPGGGPSWGMTGVQTTDGSWCSGLMGNVIGTHLGEIDRKLGLLYEIPPDRGWGPCEADQGPTAARPVAFMPPFGNAGGLRLITRGAAEQRLLPGRTVLWGRATPSVVSVTIRTPRDVRTVRPSNPGNGLVVVYDGTFPTSEAQLTVRLRDGSTKEQTAWLGGTLF